MDKAIARVTATVPALEFIDQLRAVFRLARQHQEIDVLAHEPLTDDLEHADKLAEHEDLVAFVAQFLEAFEQRIEFGARQIAVRGIDERGMAADLAEAQQAREHVETHGGERVVRLDAKKMRTRAFQFRVVEHALCTFELDDEIVLGARRKVRRGLGLGAT